MFEEKITMTNESADKVLSPTFEKRVYTIDEVMDILKIGKNTAYLLANSGKFRCVKVGGQYRISKRSFDHWLENMEGGEM